MLNSNKVRYKACANAGRIIVPEEEIAALGRRKSDVEAKAQMLRGASMRVMFLGCAVFGVLSTTYLLRDATLWM